MSITEDVKNIGTSWKQAKTQIEKDAQKAAEKAVTPASKTKTGGA